MLGTSLGKVRRWARESPLRECWVSYRHLGVRDTDIFLAAYPKSGMTWMRNLLAAYFRGTTDNWLDDIRLVSHYVGNHGKLKSYLANNARLIKTHEPYRKVYRRAVLLLRDGRDVAVSEYNFRKSYLSQEGFKNIGFSDFLQMFLEGKVNGYGAWHKHVESWRKSGLLEQNQLHIVTYEGLKQDAEKELTGIVQFLGEVPQIERIEEAVVASSVARMRKSEAKVSNESRVGKQSFIRSGVAGGWKNYFDEQDEQRFFEKTSKVMEGLGYA